MRHPIFVPLSKLKLILYTLNILHLKFISKVQNNKEIRTNSVKHVNQYGKSDILGNNQGSIPTSNGKFKPDALYEMGEIWINTFCSYG